MSDVVEKPAGLPRRSKLIAVLLTLFLPPAGFAYVRRLGWGVGLVLASPLLMFMAGKFGLPFTPSGYYITLALLGLLIVVKLLLAFRFARALPVGAQPRWYNRWYHYVWIAVMGALVGNLMLGYRGVLFGYETFRIPSTAMRPTLMVGDFIVADTRTEATANVQRGDIVIYVPAAHPDQTWVKRVVGLPGETVHAVGNDVEIDGEPVAEWWATTRNPAFQSPMQFEDSMLGQDEYFLVGDDRSNSIDSRLTGPVDRTALRGKVTAIWFHFSPKTGMDTSRVGSLPSANSHEGINHDDD